MAFPQVVAVAPGSAAALAGVVAGDEIRAMNGSLPRDIIEYQLLADELLLELSLARGGIEREVIVARVGGEALGIEVTAAVFDRVRTCDNHCSFCFIYQLPKGLRRSLYMKDDDYRLSFLYGNFTTLTRFTELDLERIVDEGLSPLYVSIHATDPDVRARLLRNRRGATSLRWLRALLDAGVVVHGQVVVCPGVNDGAVLTDTLATALERFPELASLALVPLGVSRYSNEPEMRPHSPAEAGSVIEIAERAQAAFADITGRRVVYASDEFYLVAGAQLPPLSVYESESQVENGVGLVRAFEASFAGHHAPATMRSGFFQSVEGAPAWGYRAPRTIGATAPVEDQSRPIVILTARYGALLLPSLLATAGRSDVAVVEVENRFFGGNIAVAGLMCGEDVQRTLETLDRDARVLLPDICLSKGHFLDGLGIEDLGRQVEIVETTGRALAEVLGLRPVRRRLAVEVAS